MNSFGNHSTIKSDGAFFSSMRKTIRHIICFLTISFIGSVVHGVELPAFDKDKIHEYDEFWPTHVKILEETETDNGKISTGTRGVLIRIEGDLALIDLGRQGIVRVPYSRTDIVQSTELNYKGKGDKTYPLMTGLIGNKLIKLGANGEFRNVTPLEIENLHYYLLVSLPRSSGFTDQVIELLKYHYSSWRKYQLEIVHFSRESSSAAQLEFFKEYNIPWKSLSYNMIEPYQKVFSLAYAQEPAIYLVSRNGPILYQTKLPGDLTKIADSITQNLDEKVLSSSQR